MKKNINYLFMGLFMAFNVQAAQVEEVQNQQPAETSVLDGFEPKVVWSYFSEISRIPRASGNEFAIGEYILSQAKKNGLHGVRDNVGNIIVCKPASSDLYKNSPVIVIQSHLDMVCEKNKNIEHDFSSDPIKFVHKDNFLYANGTTLGADNGIGVAAQLALMESQDIAHGPLELLFTVQEETTFEGARNIGPDKVKGRTLLNIDTEEEGSLYIGCAGSSSVIGKLLVKREKLDNTCKVFSIIIDGLRGGHSGVDIDKDRVNALKIANFVLKYLKNIDYRLVSINGGNKINAIARDVEIVIAVSSEQELLFNTLCEDIRSELHKEYSVEKGLIFKVNDVQQSQDVISKDCQSQVLSILDTMLHGIVKMSDKIEQLVETSTNFARITTKEDYISFDTMQRSLVNSEMNKVVYDVSQIFESNGISCQVGSGSPEWQPNINSRVLEVAKNTFKKVFARDPQVKAIHAGLECGAFVSQISDLDAISFGPTIHDAHSPNEHLDINAVKTFWLFLTNLITDISQDTIKG